MFMRWGMLGLAVGWGVCAAGASAGRPACSPRGEAAGRQAGFRLACGVRRA